MWSSEALHAEAQTLTPQDLLAFLPRLLSRLHVDVLYHVRLFFCCWNGLPFLLVEWFWYFCVCVCGGGGPGCCRGCTSTCCTTYAFLFVVFF